MKLGVLTVPLSGISAEEAFKYLSGLGVQAVEIGAGGSPGSAHLKPAEIVSDPSKAAEYKALVGRYGLEISALSVHGNPVHPNAAIARKAHDEFITACRAAEKLGVDTVITFSGCPGDCSASKYPNWVTCSWPDDYRTILKYQWEEVLIPYWQSAVKEAAGYGIYKIALEMHPGFCVYNPGSLLRLREAAGEAIGANFDPSHLFWQGIEPAAAIKALKGAIYHFHAKDTLIDRANTAVNGVLDQAHYGDMLDRSWMFRTVGYGHDMGCWKEIVSALRLVGYEGSISIEHEDGLMSQREGLEKAVAFLKEVLIFQNSTEMWWA